MYQGKRGTHGNHDNRGKSIRLPPDADSGVTYSEVACLEGRCLAEQDTGNLCATTENDLPHTVPVDEKPWGD